MGWECQARGTRPPYHCGWVSGSHVVSVPSQHDIHTEGADRLVQIQDLRDAFKVELLALCSEVLTHSFQSHPWRVSQKTDDYSRIPSFSIIQLRYTVSSCSGDLLRALKSHSFQERLSKSYLCSTGWSGLWKDAVGLLCTEVFCCNKIYA